MKTKKQKVKEALARQDIYNGLTTEEKIKLVESRPGNSKRELAKLKKS